MPETAVLVWLRLVRAYHKVERVAVEHLRGHGLSAAQFDVLAQVGAHPERTQQELADSLLVTKANVCQLLDRMETSGLVTRRPDGRAKRITLTPRGRQLFDQVVPTHEAMIAERFGALDVAEQHTLLRLLRKLDRALPRGAAPSQE